MNKFMGKYTKLQELKKEVKEMQKVLGVTKDELKELM